MEVAQGTEAAESLERGSLFLARNLIEIAIYNISYIRGLFPEKYFSDHSVPPLNEIRCKKLLPIDTESKYLIDSVEKGFYDTLQKKYLKTLLFCIFEKEEGPMIEEYAFSFTYPNSNTEEVAIHMSCTRTTEKRTAFKLHAAEATPDKMRCYTCKMIREIISCLRTVEPLPKKRMILTKLLYDIETPDDYVPPYVNGCSDSKAINVWNKNPLKMGDSNTKNHVHLKITGIPSDGDDSNTRDDEMGESNQCDCNNFSDLEIYPSEANRYIVPLSDDSFREERLTAQVIEWICARSIRTINVTDVHKNFPALSMEKIEDIFVSLNRDGVPKRSKDNVQTPRKSGYVLVASSKKIQFMLDSGATHHVCNDISIMRDIKYVPQKDQVIVYSCDDRELKAERMGSVVYRDFKLSQVGYIKDMPFNVVSVGQLATQGLLTSVGEGKFTIIEPIQAKLVGEGFLQKSVDRETKKKYHEYVFRSMDWIVPTIDAKLIDDPTYLDSSVGPEKPWIIDTGCARHMVQDLHLLRHPRKKVLPFEGAGGTFWSTHEGSLKVGQLELKDVLCVSEVTDNLISGLMLDLSGHRLVFNSTRCTIVHKDGLKEKGIGKMERGTRMYHLQTVEEAAEESTTKGAGAAEAGEQRSHLQTVEEAAEDSTTEGAGAAEAGEQRSHLQTVEEAAEESTTDGAGAAEAGEQRSHLQTVKEAAEESATDRASAAEAGEQRKKRRRLD